MPTRRRFLGAVPAVLAATAAPALLAREAMAAKPGTPPSAFSFGDISWAPRQSRGAEGPGPNVFLPENTWVDSGGNLHLRIARARGRWTCAEAIGLSSVGYGTYRFLIATSLAALDRNAVLGLFTWNDSSAYNHREMDIEFARWGNAGEPTNGQYVVQPAGTPGNLVRFTEPPGAAPSAYSFTWLPGSVSFASSVASPSAWEYGGPDVPLPGGEAPHINLWLMDGRSPADGQPIEVILSDFQFTPA